MPGSPARPLKSPGRLPRLPKVRSVPRAVVIWTRSARSRAESIPRPVRAASSGSMSRKSKLSRGEPLLVARGSDRNRPPWAKTSWVTQLVIREKLVAPMTRSFRRTNSRME